MEWDPAQAVSILTPSRGRGRDLRPASVFYTPSLNSRVDRALRAELSYGPRAIYIIEFIEDLRVMGKSS